MNLIKTLAVTAVVASNLFLSTQAFAGKNCPVRGCTSGDDPNGSSLHGLTFDAPIKVCPTRNCGSAEDPNGAPEHVAAMADVAADASR